MSDGKVKRRRRADLSGFRIEIKSAENAPPLESVCRALYEEFLAWEKRRADAGEGGPDKH